MNRDLAAHLSSLRRKSELMDPNLVKSYLFQVLKALQFCHSHTILHRDLKPANLLIDQSGLIKVSDFGLARAFQIPIRDLSKEVVTLWYRCPELLLGDQHGYSTPIDMWSAGCIFYELATSRTMAPGDSELDQLFRYFQLFGTPNEKTWPGVQKFENFNPNFPLLIPSKFYEFEQLVGEDGLDLFKQMMTYDPKSRISAKKALDHPYFDNIRDQYARLVMK